MNKIKLFEAITPIGIEAKINKWTEENSNCEIKNISFSYCDDIEQINYGKYKAIIVYKEGV